MSVAWELGDPSGYNFKAVPNNPVVTRTLTDDVTGAYTLTLSVTERLTGMYRCEVTSVRPDDIMVSPGMYVTSEEMTISGEYNNM